MLAAVCASFSPSASAFTVGPVNGPAHAARTSSTPENEASTLSSSPNDDDYFFTAPTKPQDDDSDDDKIELETKATSTSDIGMVSAEQTELETMEVAIEEEEDLLSTSSVLASALSIPPPAPATFMDVDGNGTGALMKRSPAAGGVDPPLMATNPYLAYPIDSGKEGMQAHDTRERTRKPSNGGIVDSAQPKTRLVRYSLPASDALEPSQEPIEKRLVLAPPSSKESMNSELARPKRSPMQPSKPRLVRYNGPDVENSTDYDGMELPSVKDKRNRELKLTRANLVRYNGASQTKQLTEEVPISNESGDESGKTGTEDDHQKGRRTLVEDPGYANRYTGLSDYNLARKTGLAVNKPISLWVERDKFL